MSKRLQSWRIHYRVHPMVKVKLEEKASAAGMCLSEYMREIAYRKCGFFVGDDLEPMLMGESMYEGEKIYEAGSERSMKGLDMTKAPCRVLASDGGCDCESTTIKL